MKFFKYLPFFTLASLCTWYFFSYSGSFKSLWINADREAIKLLKEGKEKEALKTFDNQLNVGAIYYSKGQFKKALSVYETLGSKEAFYNRGNTLVMLGKYNEAIESYKLAIEVDRDFKEAQDNLLLAKARQAILDESKKQGNKEGTGGKLGADKIVFDNKNNEGGEMSEQQSGAAKQEGNVAWLDRLETSPAKFLETKFFYQLQTKEAKK